MLCLQTALTLETFHERSSSKPVLHLDVLVALAYRPFVPTYLAALCWLTSCAADSGAISPLSLSQFLPLEVWQVMRDQHLAAVNQIRLQLTNWSVNHVMASRTCLHTDL